MALTVTRRETKSMREVGVSEAEFFFTIKSLNYVPPETDSFITIRLKENSSVFFLQIQTFFRIGVKAEV